MAFLFCDSFDHYATADLLSKWTSSVTAGAFASLTIDSSSGRRASAGLRASYSDSGSLTNYASKTVTASGNTFVIGMAFRTDVAPPSTGTGILAVYDSGTVQLTLVLLNDFRLQVRRGSVSGTILGTQSSASFGVNTYVYIEFKGTIDPSAGTINVRVNGTSVLSGSSLNTRNTASSTWTAFHLGIENGDNPGNDANECEFDDLYVLDGSGSAPLNDFLGDVRVDARYPSGAGSNTGWTASAGANYTCVDETAPNGDTDYVAAASSPLTDTYATQDAPVPGAALYAVQLSINAKKSDAGACTLAPIVRHSGTDNAGATFNPGTSYGYNVTPYPTNPGTGAAWTEAGFNAAEFGVRRTA